MNTTSLPDFDQIALTLFGPSLPPEKLPQPNPWNPWIGGVTAKAMAAQAHLLTHDPKLSAHFKRMSRDHYISELRPAKNTAAPSAELISPKQKKMIT